MTVAVIGGAGFIGSNLVDALMSQDCRVTVLDDLSEGKLGNLAAWADHPRFEFVLGDIRDRDLVRRVTEGKDWVFHLAAMSRIQPSITDPHLAFEQNILGTVNVLEGCRLGGVKRFVYSASSSAYGDANLSRLSQGSNGLREDMPLDFGSPYALSKHFGEEAAALYCKLYGLSTISLRYFNVYGPRHQESGSYATVIAIFRRQARDGEPITLVGDGLQRRDFTFVGDVVRANVLAARKPEVNGTFNIGYGQNFNMQELAAMIAPGHPVRYLPQRPGEYRITLADSTKARTALGWKPQVDLRMGLAILDKFEHAPD